LKQHAHPSARRKTLGFGIERLQEFFKDFRKRGVQLGVMRTRRQFAPLATMQKTVYVVDGNLLPEFFLSAGTPATVKGLEAASAAITSAQKELFTALRNLSDSRGGVVAQIESANNRLTYSLESRAQTVDALLHELNNDVLRI
jgi:hypothetical protein